MIHKSYLVEENLNLLAKNIVLFYGENLGLINEFKEKIESVNKDKKIIKFTQDNVFQNENLIFDEVYNSSLFNETKIIYVYEVTDKILKILEEIESKVKEDKIYLFGNILEKKSKLRAHFEKSKDYDVVPCYKDSEITIKKLIQKKLTGYSGLTTQIQNILMDNCGLDRIKLNNELNKIKIFFNDKILKFEKINELLNNKSDGDFNSIKDFALKGNNEKTNNLLSNIILEVDQIPLYLSSINQRLNKLRELAINAKKSNLSEAMKNLKPPVFWKDKPNFLKQAEKWDGSKIRHALNKTYEMELKIKSDVVIDKKILIKKLLLDICLIANT
tara:strand:+ start:9236 stop:10225 length:990 start_codon:yes stop_codon:yes gene_type:complete